ncbi:MAG: hypothetical protein IKA75_04825 [Bacteroidaceae bacterium]|nr:hypothetical protein [Bacteroidaceae bacterium]
MLYLPRRHSVGGCNYTLCPLPTCRRQIPVHSECSPLAVTNRIRWTTPCKMGQKQRLSWVNMTPRRQST